LPQKEDFFLWYNNQLLKLCNHFLYEREVYDQTDLSTKDSSSHQSAWFSQEDVDSRWTPSTETTPIEGTPSSDRSDERARQANSLVSNGLRDILRRIIDNDNP
jgi:hypothetical protein